MAYPHLVDNPIHRVAPFLHELSTQVWDEGNEHFPATSMQVSNINAGTGVENVVPGEIDLVFNFRYSTALTAEDIKARIADMLQQHQLDNELGMQVHRSWWVAHNAIEGIQQSGKKFYLAIKNGDAVPVSIPYQGMLKELARAKGISIKPIPTA